MKFLVKLFGKNVFVEGSPYGKKANFSDYYLVRVYCSNCKNYMVIYVKKGVHINDVITAVKCNNCGVRLEKQEK